MTPLLLYICSKKLRRTTEEGFSSGRKSGFARIFFSYLNPLMILDAIFESITFVWVVGYYYTIFSV